MTTPSPTTLARALRTFFSDYLPTLRGLSPHTMQSYRDTLVLLLRFVAHAKHLDPVCLALGDLRPEEVLAFLQHLETERHNKASTRNVRLAAIHAFFRHVATQCPEHLEQAQRIQNIPIKRAQTPLIDYLDYHELCAVLESVDRSHVDGRRDYALLVTMFNTGARVQEIVDLQVRDLQLTKPCQVRLYGKGRKVRVCPIWPQTADLLRQLCDETGIDPQASAPLFRNHRGERLTRFGVRYILARHCERAKATCPSLVGKRLHPHSMRHYLPFLTMSCTISKVWIFQPIR
jgi:site-specific recombinase XerD